MFFTYVLKSKKDQTHYYGHTQNLDTRLNYHNSGKVKYTTGHRPYEIIYSEEFANRSEAVKRELFFKSLSGYKWLKENEII
jgi:putative endonuclease